MITSLGLGVGEIKGLILALFIASCATISKELSSVCLSVSFSNR